MWYSLCYVGRMRTLALFFAAWLCFAADVAGTYKGTWSGGAASGEIRMKLDSAGNGTWNADVVFTLGTDEVKTKVTSVKVDGAKVEVVYQFDLQGNTLESTATGQVTDKTLEGAYKTKAVADGSPVDEEGTLESQCGKVARSSARC